MTRAGTFLTAMAAVALVLLPARVLAHGPTAEIVVTPPIVEPGERILVQGHNLWTDEMVSIRIVDQSGVSTELGIGETTGEGVLEASFTLPATVSAGRYEVIARNGLGEEAEGPLIVEASDGSPLVIVGIGGVAAGAVLLLVLDRRRRAAAR